MRVLLLNQTFYPDVAATAQHAHDLGRHLVEAGHDVLVVTSRSIYGQKSATLPRRQIVDGIQIYRVGASRFGKSSITLRALDFGIFYTRATWRVLTLPQVDVVVGFTTPPLIALVGWLNRALCGGRYVYWVMDLYPDVAITCGVLRHDGLPARFFEWVSRFCLRRADRVVALGRCMRRRLADKGVPDARLAQIGVWADGEEIRPVPRKQNPYRLQWQLGEALVIMYSGNLGIAHDTATISKAMLRLRERRDIQFVFVGGGKQMQAMRDFVSEHKLAQVQFHPYQPRQQLGDLISLGDVHLMSLREDLTGMLVPSKLFGVLAAARPVLFVGDAASEVAQVVNEANCGQTIRVGDVDGLVEAIEQFADDPDLVREMGAAGREALEQRYDRVLACAAWERLLADCVGETPARP